MARYKKGESGNPKGRPQGSRNRNQFRERVGEVLDGQLTVKKLNDTLDELEPKEKINALLRLLEFVVPRLKGIEALIEIPEVDKPLWDLGRLTKEQRTQWYELYNQACGKNGEDEPIKTTPEATG